MNIFDFYPYEWILQVKKMSAHDVYFSAQGYETGFLALFNEITSNAFFQSSNFYLPFPSLYKRVGNKFCTP